MNNTVRYGHNNEVIARVTVRYRANTIRNNDGARHRETTSKEGDIELNTSSEARNPCFTLLVILLPHAMCTSFTRANVITANITRLSDRVTDKSNHLWYRRNSCLRTDLNRRRITVTRRVFSKITRMRAGVTRNVAVQTVLNDDAHRGRKLSIMNIARVVRRTNVTLTVEPANSLITHISINSTISTTVHYMYYVEKVTTIAKRVHTIIMVDGK